MTHEAPTVKKQQSVITKAFEIIFIFALALICIVVPVVIQGGAIVGGDGISISWNPVLYFGTLGIIIVFFVVILVHSVKSYDY